MLDADAAATPAEILAALQSSASPVGAFGPCAVGSGLIDAAGAIANLLKPPIFTPSECQLPEAGSVEEAQAPGEWGVEGSTPPPPETQKVAEAVPSTFIRRKPPHLVRTRRRTARVVFGFGSDLAGATFACRVDASLYRLCRQRLVRRFGLGSHALRVFARNASGIGDPTPAVYRFRVKRVRR
jgi:hypothetical protein